MMFKFIATLTELLQLMQVTFGQRTTLLRNVSGQSSEDENYYHCSKIELLQNLCKRICSNNIVDSTLIISSV